MLTRLTGRAAAALVVVSALAVGSCDTTPLLAPTGSTIALVVPTVSVATNQNIVIIAHVVESSGTPPQSGTRVNFTTSLGTIQSSADTDSDGQAKATFSTGGSNGTATITAASGKASTTATVSISPPVVLINANPSGLSTGNPNTIDYAFQAVVIPDTNVVGYSWNFGDNSGTVAGSDKKNTNHIYTVTSTSRTVTLTITTQNGQQAIGSIALIPSP
jgi:hypothetical protein